VSIRLSAEQQAALAGAWRAMLRDYPAAYLTHRVQTSALMLGFEQAALPNHMIFEYAHMQVADNPPLPPRDVPSPSTWNRLLQPLLDSPLFAFWPYGLVLLAVAASARLRRPVNPLLPPVLASALLVLLPLLVVAPSVEFRYLVWPVFAAALAVVLRLAPPGGAVELAGPPMPGVPAPGSRP
jgi:hypothetical protein